jgi:hypothetical protein
MENKTSRWPALLGLVLAAIGILAPIAWDLIKAKNALRLVYAGETILVSKSEGLKKLRLTYDGKELGSITAMRFSLANSGRRPITGSDLIAAPEIALQGKAEILDYVIESVFPNNLVVNLEKSAPNAVRVSFPLLNSGDNVNFALLVADAKNQEFSASARIIGVDNLQLDRRSEEPARAKAGRSWTQWVVGGFSVFAVLISLACAADIRSEVRCKRKVSSQIGLFTVDMTKEEALGVLLKNLSWTTDVERKGISSFLQSLPSGGKLSSDDVAKATALFNACVQSATSNVGVSIVFFAIGVFGALYAYGVFS